MERSNKEGRRDMNERLDTAVIAEEVSFSNHQCLLFFNLFFGAVLCPFLLAELPNQRRGD